MTVVLRSIGSYYRNLRGRRFLESAFHPNSLFKVNECHFTLDHIFLKCISNINSTSYYLFVLDFVPIHLVLSTTEEENFYKSVLIQNFEAVQEFCKQHSILCLEFQNNFEYYYYQNTQVLQFISHQGQCKSFEFQNFNWIEQFSSNLNLLNDLKVLKHNFLTNLTVLISQSSQYLYTLNENEAPITLELKVKSKMVKNCGECILTVLENDDLCILYYTRAFFLTSNVKSFSYCKKSKLLLVQSNSKLKLFILNIAPKFLGEIELGEVWEICDFDTSKVWLNNSNTVELYLIFADESQNKINLHHLKTFDFANQLIDVHRDVVLLTSGVFALNYQLNKIVNVVGDKLSVDEALVLAKDLAKDKSEQIGCILEFFKIKKETLSKKEIFTLLNFFETEGFTRIPLLLRKLVSLFDESCGVLKKYSNYVDLTVEHLKQNNSIEDIIPNPLEYFPKMLEDDFFSFSFVFEPQVDWNLEYIYSWPQAAGISKLSENDSSLTVQNNETLKSMKSSLHQIENLLTIDLIFLHIFQNHSQLFLPLLDSYIKSRKEQDPKLTYYQALSIVGGDKADCNCYQHFSIAGLYVRLNYFIDCANYLIENKCFDCFFELCNANVFEEDVVITILISIFENEENDLDDFKIQFLDYLSNFTFHKLTFSTFINIIDNTKGMNNIHFEHFQPILLKLMNS
eukprot:TRINITY_DN3218_c1_g3_i1.p1 TRINITY_DN3218_c1_g3~~TRINITY_DN3218_c1_g3_i1.p1  ORF type:complete len:690 (+),score=190.17 TRINITY_DN3218_c1_g3_i1:26-2071(+)